MRKLMELAETAIRAATDKAIASSIWSDSSKERREFCDAYDEARAALQAEIARLTEAHDWQYKMAGERLRRVEVLEHNIEVLTNALWKSCGDDEDTVNATIESQGVLK